MKVAIDIDIDMFLFRTRILNFWFKKIILNTFKHLKHIGRK